MSFILRLMTIVSYAEYFMVCRNRCGHTGYKIIRHANYEVTMIN